MTDGSISILGVPVGRFALATLLTRLQAMLHQPGCAYTYGVNAYALNLACRNQEFFQHLIEADLIFADGASLLLAARVLGGRLPEKITTTDLWPRDVRTRRPATSQILSSGR